MIQTQATHTLTAEEFLTSSGLMRRWKAEALAIALKEVLPDAGLDLRRVEQRGAVLKLRIGFPPSHTPSLKPKLGHKLRTLVKRTGKNTLPATTWVWAPQHTVHGKY